jgi:integrase
VAKVAKTGKHVRFHDLRRTAVSLMRDLGVTEGDISATTGHSIATKGRSGNKKMDLILLGTERGERQRLIPADVAVVAHLTI